MPARSMKVHLGNAAVKRLEALRAAIVERTLGGLRPTDAELVSVGLRDACMKYGIPDPAATRGEGEKGDEK